MSKYQKQYFNVEGIVKTAGELNIERGISVDDLLAMQPGDEQWFGEGDTMVCVIRL